jgi:aromatic ring-opening dioxygenase LigB subunit
MTETVTIGAIAPHDDEAVPDACDETNRHLAVKTQRAMDEMARRVARAGPEAIIIATPHNVHVTGHMAVLTSSQLTGQIDEAPKPVSFSCRVDRELALGIHDEMRAADIPTVAVSFGGNVPAESVGPLDWGSIVPLWHIARHAPDLPVAVVVPARDLDVAAHVRAGAAAVRAARQLVRRVAFVASADQGHGHSHDGPYGYHAESAAFDRRVCDAVERGTLEHLVSFTTDEVSAAVVDSWWQMVMLHGALEEDGSRFRAELLSYEAPTYVGLLTAVFERA